MHELPTLLTGRNNYFYGENPRGALSLKMMFNGEAIYRTNDGRVFAVNDNGYLILNNNQPYSIEKVGLSSTETLCIFFPENFASDVLHSLSTMDDRLLEQTDPNQLPPVRFLETVHAQDSAILRLANPLRQKSQADAPLSWWEEQFYRLMEALLDKQGQIIRESERLSAIRPATRFELQARLHLARDYIAANLEQQLTLGEVSRIALLSPHYLRRTFKELFGETPHSWLSKQRLAKSCFLLSHTSLSITEICFTVGFSSPGSFSSWFHASTHHSPREFRKNSHFQEVFTAATVKVHLSNSLSRIGEAK